MWLTLGIANVIGFAAYHDAVKREAFNYAKGLVKSKGILNLGSGQHRTGTAWEIATSPLVKVNIDIVPDGLPNFMQWDIEQGLPFPEATFDAVLISHTLEHTGNWEFVLREASRVSDKVIVVLPHPLDLMNWLHPGHKHLFLKSDMTAIEKAYPKVVVFN